MRKAKLNREYSCFLNELQTPPAASIQQPQTETESNGIKLVAACIKVDMWLEAHSLASMLLKPVTKLLLRQRILNPLEAGGA